MSDDLLAIADELNREPERRSVDTQRGGPMNRSTTTRTRHLRLMGRGGESYRVRRWRRHRRLARG